MRIIRYKDLPLAVFDKKVIQKVRLVSTCKWMWGVRVRCVWFYNVEFQPINNLNSDILGSDERWKNISKMNGQTEIYTTWSPTDLTLRYYLYYFLWTQWDLPNDGEDVFRGAPCDVQVLHAYVKSIPDHFLVEAGAKLQMETLEELVVVVTSWGLYSGLKGKEVEGILQKVWTPDIGEEEVLLVDKVPPDQGEVVILADKVHLN